MKDSDLLRRTSVFYDGVDHAECVAVHPDGSVWAGGEAGQIYRIDKDGRTCEEIASTGGFVLGIAFSPGAEWLAICDLKHKCLWHLDMATGNLSLFSNECEGHAFNIPNYAAFDDAGNLYVSESGAFRQENGKILKFDPVGNGQVWHPGPFNFANGLALDADRNYLYVVCSWLPGVERIEIRPDGSSGNREVVWRKEKIVPDGIAFDAEGNLYTSCYAPNAIFLTTPGGDTRCIIDDWEAHTLSNPTNIAFGGEGHDQLFSSNLGRWHISRIDLGVKGLPLPSHNLLTHEI